MCRLPFAPTIHKSPSLGLHGNKQRGSKFMTLSIRHNSSKGFHITARLENSPAFLSINLIVTHSKVVNSYVKKKRLFEMHRLILYGGFESKTEECSLAHSHYGIMRYWPTALYLISWVSIRQKSQTINSAFFRAQPF
jgi:hypothetical protein